MKIKHIYLFSSYNLQGISTRYRGVYVLKEFEQKYSIKSTFIYPSYSLSAIIRFFKAYLSVLFSFQNDSVVIYQKLYTKGIYTKLLKILIRLKPQNSIYDTDDADYLRYYDENIYYFMKHSKLCTVGSKALFDFAKAYNEDVLLLTSPVVPHAEIKVKRNPVLNIGWIGDYGLNKEYTSPFSHKISLNEILFPVLKELDFNFKLTILGVKNPDDKKEIEYYFKDHSNIILEIPEDVNWLDEYSIYQRIKAFDIGVSPMVDHPFNVAKSAFKVKQYLSCGVPVLASPIGENLTFVKNRVNGFLCENSKDFKQRIIQINNMNNHEYSNLSKHAIQALDEFSIKKYCEDLQKEITQNNILG